MVESYTQLL